MIRRAVAIVRPPTRFTSHGRWATGRCSRRRIASPSGRRRHGARKAAGWDVVISGAAYFAAALAARRLDWAHLHARWPYAIYFAVGLALTTARERWAVSVGRWRFRDAMPTIAGIGLSPLLQWIIIPAAILLIAGRATRACR